MVHLKRILFSHCAMFVIVSGFLTRAQAQQNPDPEKPQFFATDQRLYRFAVIGGDAKHAGVQRFFSSIRLGQQTAGIEVSEPPKDPLEIDGERIFTAKEVDVKVKFILRPDPEYTQAARMKGISGTVKLKAVCSATGQVTHIQVIKGLPLGLTERAIAAAMRIRFTPAMKGGKPVSMWMRFDYSFNLH